MQLSVIKSYRKTILYRGTGDGYGQKEAPFQVPPNPLPSVSLPVWCISPRSRVFPSPCGTSWQPHWPLRHTSIVRSIATFSSCGAQDPLADFLNLAPTSLSNLDVSLSFCHRTSRYATTLKILFLMIVLGSALAISM